jgi:NAD(P)H-dependent flavin oxidoreductase YrpB (nitropropane dioxygenase family)
VLLAGGVADAAEVREALSAGAAGVVAGTRYVLSEESGAHPEYLRRLVEARDTILTQLFGIGWPDAPHRVVPNAATQRWLRRDPRGPVGVRLLNRISAPLASRLPQSLVSRSVARQRPGLPFFGPAPLLAGNADRLVEATPLYAGVSVERIQDVRPAGALTRELAG